MFFPFLEICNNTPNAPKKINLDETNYEHILDIRMKDFDGTIIILEKEYEPKKTELDLWKETALKSYFLIDQINRLTGHKLDDNGDNTGEDIKYENIAPLIDLFQNIKIPSTCTELDKEKAGVPSSLTNIT